MGQARLQIPEGHAMAAVEEEGGEAAGESAQGKAEEEADAEEAGDS